MIMGKHLVRNTNMAEISLFGVFLLFFRCLFERTLALYLDTSLPALRCFLFSSFFSFESEYRSLWSFTVSCLLFESNQPIWVLVVVNITWPWRFAQIPHYGWISFSSAIFFGHLFSSSLFLAFTPFSFPAYFIIYSLIYGNNHPFLRLLLL